MTRLLSVSPSPHLRLVCFPSACVVLDLEQGSVTLLSEEAAWMITCLDAAKGEASALRLSAREEPVLAELVSAGVLREGETPSSWECVRRGAPSSPSWGTRDSPAALSPIPRAPLRWYVLGVLALLVVLSGGLGNRRNTFTHVRLLTRPRSTGLPDHGTATEAAHAVRAVGRLLPLRVACWEEAAATTVALRWAGYRASFRHGAATDPVRLHAWVEVGGRPVAESDDITDYTPFEESRE
ncbi:lasso peptide biosynthesis B2 protein [Nocardiopsis lucentensis]|uniref:lasso peptide biosynthesis B2 protein n=1 Tax=Nocardiopsis lucentensis TaxID=53441 RepID=UPI00034D7F0B|nr:lasso peptide biosynthesis B2 protein [Nocardiopsis lucentensis]